MTTIIVSEALASLAPLMLYIPENQRINAGATRADGAVVEGRVREVKVTASIVSRRKRNIDEAANPSGATRPNRSSHRSTMFGEDRKADLDGHQNHCRPLIYPRLTNSIIDKE